MLLAIDLARGQGVLLGKLGLQIDRKDENAIGFRYGNRTRLDVTQSTVGTADQQIQAAWQVSDIRAEVAELRARGIKVEDCDTPGPKTEDGIADIGFAWPPGSSTQPRTSSAPARCMSSNLARATPRWASAAGIRGAPAPLGRHRVLRPSWAGHPGYNGHVASMAEEGLREHSETLGRGSGHHRCRRRDGGCGGGWPPRGG